MVSASADIPQDTILVGIGASPGIAIARSRLLNRDRIAGIIVESKAGREAILARVVIDATGDADGAWDPGETVTIPITLRASATLSNAGGTLACTTPGVTILDGTTAGITISGKGRVVNNQYSNSNVSDGNANGGLVALGMDFNEALFDNLKVSRDDHE